MKYYVTRIMQNDFKFIQMPEEKFSSLSHLFGAILATIGAVLLGFHTFQRKSPFIIGLIYSFSVIQLFLASFLFHSRKEKENEDSLWRKFDHIAIFIMIAGTYTPMSFIYLQGFWRLLIIIAQWTMVIAGLIFKFILIKAPRKLTTTIYLVQGWMAILPIYQFYTEMPSIVFIYTLTGGILYTIGAVIYMIKKPNPIPNRFGFHEIFHLFILAGALVHYLMIWNTLS